MALSPGAACWRIGTGVFYIFLLIKDLFAIWMPTSPQLCNVAPASDANKACANGNLKCMVESKDIMVATLGSDPVQRAKRSVLNNQKVKAA